MRSAMTQSLLFLLRDVRPNVVRGLKLRRMRRRSLPRKDNLAQAGLPKPV